MGCNTDNQQQPPRSKINPVAIHHTQTRDATLCAGQPAMREVKRGSLETNHKTDAMLLAQGTSVRDARLLSVPTHTRNPQEPSYTHQRYR
jgi:hypothetical protein